MPVSLPLIERSGERLLHDFFGQVEVAQEPDERGEDAGRAHRCRCVRFQAVGHAGSMTAKSPDPAGSGEAAIAQIGRTSTVPHRAPGIRAAMAVASSRLAARPDSNLRVARRFRRKDRR